MNSKRERRTFCEICNITFALEVQLTNHCASLAHSQVVKEKEAHFLKRGVWVVGISSYIPHALIADYVDVFGENTSLQCYSTSFTACFVEEDSATKFIASSHELLGPNVTATPLRDFPGVHLQFKVTQNDRFFTAAIRNIKQVESFGMQVSTLMNDLLLTNHFVATKTRRIITDIKNVLMPMLHQMYVYPFGSCFYDAAMKGSGDIDFHVALIDIIKIFRTGTTDVSIKSPTHVARKIVKEATQFFKNSSTFVRVQPIIAAKVPIIKCIHRSTHFKCDVAFSSLGGVQNTALIKYYISLDNRVKELIVIVKCWMKFYEMKELGLSSYGSVMLVLFYLMQLNPQVIPPICELQKNQAKNLFVDSWHCSFSSDYQFPRRLLTNRMTVLQLLTGFFEFYSRFDFGIYVLCPFVGKPVSKVDFLVMKVPKAMLLYRRNVLGIDVENTTDLNVKSSMCIQDPFYHNFNISRALETQSTNKFQNLCFDTSNILKSSDNLKSIFDTNLATCSRVYNTCGNPEIHVTLGTFLPNMAKKTISPDQTRLLWFKKGFQNIVQIFEEICGFKVNEQTTNCDPIMDRDIPFDLEFRTRIITCESAKSDVRSNRDDAKFKIQNTYDRHNFGYLELEEAVTSYLTFQVQPIEFINLTCYVHMIDCPTHVVLEFINIDSSETLFQTWVDFLKENLPTWFENCINEEPSTNGKIFITTLL